MSDKIVVQKRFYSATYWWYYTRYEKSKRNIFTGYVLNWAGKWKWWLKMYIYESQCQTPRKYNCLGIGIWDQLSDNSRRPRINKLSDKSFKKYYRITIRSCDMIVCPFGVRSAWPVVWVSKKVNDPNTSGVVLVLMLVRSLLAWSRLYSKHEMHAAELSYDVESEVQAAAVSVKEFRCESHRQTFTGIYFFGSK